MARAPKKTEPTPAGARERALRVLARREHSAAELKYKLEARGHDERTAATVVADLAQSGWQSDARYAETLVRSRIAQGYGPLRIEAELEHACVPAAAAAAALQAADVRWAELAATLRLRRFGRSQPETPGDWQRQYRYLAGRGFTAEHVHAAIRGRDSPES